MHEIRYHNFVILHEETGFRLTFSKQNLIRKHNSKKISSTTNNIFKATYFSFRGNNKNSIVLHFLSFVTPQIQNTEGMLIRGEGTGVW